MRILVRIAALAGALALYYAMAAALPEASARIAGIVAFLTVAVGAFVWARRDGREIGLSDGLRDWLIVAFVIAVFWWVTLVLFEGASDVVEEIRRQFVSILVTVGLVFAPAALGVILGNGSRPTWDRPAGR